MEKSEDNDISNNNTSEDDIRYSVQKSRNEIKRRVHNGIEKRRKDRINHWIHKISDLLPFKDPKRESKNNILENIHNYILDLKQKNDSLMFGNNAQSIHVGEIRRLNKELKELQEKNTSYYRLLKTAGISPNCLPQDIAFDRPTKYSKKISEEQVNTLIKKGLINTSSDSLNNCKKSSKRNSDSVKDNDRNCGNSSSNKKSKSKNKIKKRKTENRKAKSSPTPLLPNNLNISFNNNSNSSTSSQSTDSGSLVLPNEQNVSAVDVTPRLIVNSANTLSSLNAMQFRPTMASQQLQILSTASTMDSINSNNNLLSGQLLFNLNPPPPQPQATAVLLPNGQILPIITQQQQQQPLIYAPNHGILLAAPTAAQTHPTFITGQTASIAANITTNTIHVKTRSNDSLNDRNSKNQKNRPKTTVIESVPVSPNPIKRKVKKHKKVVTQKQKVLKKEDVIDTSDSGNEEKDCGSSQFSDVIIDKKTQIGNNDKKNKSKTNVKAVKSCKTNDKTENNVNNCDILAKATESIFSPQTSTVKSNKKSVSSIPSKDGIEKMNSISDKTKKRQDSDVKSLASNQNEVISKYCANSAHKAIELINDTNKNDNYITSDENNSKIEQNIASSNKAEINKKLNNISTTDSTESNNSHKLSEDRSTAENEFHETIITDTNNTTNCQNSSTSNTITFGFCNPQTEPNNNDNQTIVNENELPSLLLSSLTDENDVSAESVHSVSNSSLPAFLSLSPEHLTEYLPKDSITNTNTNQTTATSLNSNNSIQFRLNSNQHNVEQHSIRNDSNRNQHQKVANFSQYSKPNEISISSTQQTDTPSYSSNFPTISSLITNDFSEFPTNKSAVSHNSHNYLENFNSTSNKINQQNNFLQFPLQNDNSLMPLYPPMHSYPNYLNTSNTYSNNGIHLNSGTNRSFFNVNDNQTNLLNTSPVKSTQNQSRQQTQQQPKQNPNQASQVSQNQSNNIMPNRTHRNTSTEQQLQPQNNALNQDRRHASQHSREVITSTTTTTTTMNKTTNSVPAVQYSNQNSFSSYSAEALIRQNEPTLQIPVNDQNRYNNPISTRIPQQNQNQSSNMNFSETNAIRNSNRPTISYSAESLIQSNSINNSNHLTNKSSRREVESESNNNLSERVPYYQHLNTNNNSGNTANSSQRIDQNSNNLFNFDHSLNSRNANTNPQNCNNNSVSSGYPQITFNSHLSDARTSTSTSSSNSVLYSNGSAVGTNSGRSPVSSVNSNNNTNSNSNNSNINNNNTGNNTDNNSNGNNQTSNSSVSQHSPIVYPFHSQNSNNQQNKRSANNSVNTTVNPFSHSSVESYVNNNANMYSSGSIVDPNLSSNTNHYQRSSRNSEIRLPTNCLQTTNQSSNIPMTQHNSSNSGCFFSNTGPVSVHSNSAPFFPPSSATPFPPLLPSAASPFDATTFGATHRPPMFTNTFITDFNPSFANSTANNTLPSITPSNFDLNNTTIVNSKARDQPQSHSRSSTAISRSPNASKHTKINASSNASNSKSNSKKVTKQQNTASDSNNSTSNSTLRQMNDNNSYFSMSDFVSSTPTTSRTNNRYSNFFPNAQNQTRHPVPSPVSQASTHSTTNKNPTPSADTSMYPLFRPQSQNNTLNVNSQPTHGSFSVNSLQNTSNRTVTTTTPSNFGTNNAQHSHHVPNFNLSNIFPDINSNANEIPPLPPMKFGPSNTIPPPPPPPPVAPPVPPSVPSSVVNPSMDTSHNPYPNQSATSPQHLYHSHHHSSRISTPHNSMTFNSFLGSGSSATQHSNTHNFEPNINSNNSRSSSTAQMPAIVNGSQSTASFPSTHHSHHSYANIVPSFNF